MSLYNMLNGVSPAAFFILPVLGKHPDWFPRFRDCFTGIDGKPEYDGKVIVYTRTGGGNRECYVEENQGIRDLPGFVCDFDDDFDSTFAYWVFDVPEEWANDVGHVMAGRAADVSQGYIDRCKSVFPKIADKIDETFDRLKSVGSKPTL